MSVQLNRLSDLKRTYNKKWFVKYKRLSIHERINFKLDYFFNKRVNPYCKIWYKVTGLPF